VTLTWIEANGQPAVLISRGAGTVGFVTVDAPAQAIDHLMWVMRPSKLGAIAHPGGAKAISA
jgi:RNA polymerase sigma-70 factor, ECF subfamily